MPINTVARAVVSFLFVLVAAAGAAPATAAPAPAAEGVMTTEEARAQFSKGTCAYYAAGVVFATKVDKLTQSGTASSATLQKKLPALKKATAKIAKATKRYSATLSNPPAAWPTSVSKLAAKSAKKMRAGAAGLGRASKAATAADWKAKAEKAGTVMAKAPLSQMANNLGYASGSTC